MIVEYGYTVLAGLVGWLFTLIPPMDGAEDLASQMSTVFDPLQAGLTGLGGWIPWGVVNVCATLTLGMWLLTLVLRVVKSFLPTVSG